MKPNITISAIFLAWIITAVLFPMQASSQQDQVDFQVFYDQLSPYGQWVDYPNYGYVWIPNAGSGFAPYASKGHWIMTDYGWTWASDYQWGWAPFHYGRWDYDNIYGWFWVPDYEWGPAWVTWRSAEGYYGWAPMEPGLSISLSFERGYDSRHDHWRFVKYGDIDRPRLHNYYVKRADRARIIGNSTVIHETYIDKNRHATYVTGPSRETVQRVSGRTITPVVIQENNKPGQALSNGRLQIYRPIVKSNVDRERKPVPSKPVALKDVKKLSERKAVNPPHTARPQIQQQQGSVKPQNNTAQPSRQRNVNPPVNNNRGLQRQAVNSPSNNNRGQQRQAVNSPSNNNRGQQRQAVNPPPAPVRVQPSQPPRSNPPANNAREQRPNPASPTNNRSEQPKEAQSGQDRKRTD